jgi:4-diphosphocytidyl-2-C-methyl-D-erythritol kinase
MLAMGTGIGADVPFFLMERGCALATGIGERLEKIGLPELWFVLIYPNFEVSTRWAYQNFGLTNRAFQLKIQCLVTPEEVCGVLMNDLEGVVSKRFPQIDQMKEILISAGALGSLMTGSGPTVFGVFAEEGQASRAYNEIGNRVKDNGWIALKAHSLP